IASYYGLTPQQVAVGNGSDELLAFAFMAYGETIYYPEISYGFYPVFRDLFHCKGEGIPLTEDLRIAVKDYFGKKGTVILANPNAPTGIALTLEEIQALLEANGDQVVIIDEAYVDFGAESAVKLIEQYDNLLVIQTFSKSRSLAGMRIGMAMGNAALIEDLNKIKFSFNPYNLSRDAIVSAKMAIEDEEYFQLTRNKIIATRKRFSEAMNKLGYTVLPSSANFVFVKAGRDYASQLREHDIIVRHFDKDPIREYVRITIGRDEEMDRLLAVTEELLCAKAK
ncbi:MAG: histidinol-phosphate transaminase, partial [Anaerovoracaceae bacterium]